MAAIGKITKILFAVPASATDISEIKFTSGDLMKEIGLIG